MTTGLAGAPRLRSGRRPRIVALRGRLRLRRLASGGARRPRRSSGAPLPVLRVAETVPTPRLSPDSEPADDTIGTLIADDENREAAAREDS